MADIVAFDLEPRAVLRASGEDVLDVRKGIAENPVARTFEVGEFPIVLELLEAVRASDRGRNSSMPMLSEATSGLKWAAGRTRSSTSMVGAPPVVMLMTQSERCLITCRKGANASGDWSGLPFCGSRACRCTIAAPASAAPIAASAISSGVIGR